jgi:hypothetical protein
MTEQNVVAALKAKYEEALSQLKALETEKTEFLNKLTERRNGIVNTVKPTVLALQAFGEKVDPLVGASGAGKPMSEAGKANIKAGLQKYYDRKKAEAGQVTAAPAAPVPVVSGPVPSAVTKAAVAPKTSTRKVAASA